MQTLRTARLEIAPFTLADAPLVLRLLNDADWLRYIGDKQVHDLDAARAYLRDGPMAMIARHGIGLCRVRALGQAEGLGMCGLIRRAGLDDVDLGFAFLPAARGQGHAGEAAAAVLAHGLGALALRRIVAITDVRNLASARVLERIGMRLERLMRLPGETTDLKLYAAGAD